MKGKIVSWEGGTESPIIKFGLEVEKSELAGEVIKGCDIVDIRLRPDGKPSEDLEKAAEKYQADARRHVLDNTPIGTAKDAFIAGAECLKDALIEWAKFVLKCQEEELAKYDDPCYRKAYTMGRIDAYKILIAKLNSL